MPKHINTNNMTKKDLQDKTLQEQHALLALLTLEADILKYDLGGLQIRAAIQGYIAGKEGLIKGLKKDIESL